MTDMTMIPNTAAPTALPPLLLTRTQVEELTGMCTSTLYNEKDAGRFPQPIRVSRGRVMWLFSDVMEWLEARKAERDAENPRRPGRPPKNPWASKSRKKTDA